MIKRIFVVILAFTVLSIFFQSCGGDKTKYVYYRWDSFDISGILTKNGRYCETDLTNNSFNKNDIGFHIYLKSKFDKSFISHKFKLINECYAHMPDFGPKEVYFMSHKLTAIQVITLNDYSENYPANSDITKLFKERKSYNVGQGSEIYNFYPIEQFIPILNADYHLGWYSLSLFLMDTNCVAGKHNFEITFNFDDGTVITKQTGIFNLH